MELVTIYNILLLADVALSIVIFVFLVEEWRFKRKKRLYKILDVRNALFNNDTVLAVELLSELYFDDLDYKGA